MSSLSTGEAHMLKTRLTELLGLDYPIVSAPMARMSGGRLAAAVSAAGGLGTFGGLSMARPTGADYVREQIAEVRACTDRPFGVGFITHWLPNAAENFDAVLAERVPVVLFSFADPRPWIGRARDSGARVICQVQTLDSARDAVAAGADVLAVQGNEAGGHTGRQALLPFLVSVVEALPSVPVVAAGGIGDGRSLAAVLAAGADGAWMGTAFMTTDENELSPATKEAVVRGSGRDTVWTEVMDILNTRMRGVPAWPGGIACRLEANAFIRKWHGREEELRAHVDEVLPVWAEATKRVDRDVLPLIYGLSADAVRSVRPAADVLREVCGTAERCLARHAAPA
jgi:nitronate monooxygenase